MIIHFEITPFWIEFWCHFLGIIFAMISGGCFACSKASDGPGPFVVTLIISIILISIGAHQ